MSYWWGNRPKDPHDRTSTLKFCSEPSCQQDRRTGSIRIPRNPFLFLPHNQTLYGPCTILLFCFRLYTKLIETKFDSTIIQVKLQKQDRGIDKHR